MGNSTSGQLHRLYAELEELTHGHGLRPPSIIEALSAATDAVQRRQAAIVAKAENSPLFSPIRAGAMAAVAVGGWLATRPRPRLVHRPSVSIEVRSGRGLFRSRWIRVPFRVAGAVLRRRGAGRVAAARRAAWIPGIDTGVGALVVAGIAAGSGWLALRRRRVVAQISR